MEASNGVRWMELMAGPVDRNSRLARLLIQLCRAVRLESLESIRANLRKVTWQPGSDTYPAEPTDGASVTRTMHGSSPTGSGFMIHRPPRPPRAEPLDATT
jgi:hypothetical protein